MADPMNGEPRPDPDDALLDAAAAEMLSDDPDAQSMFDLIAEELQRRVGDE